MAAGCLRDFPARRQGVRRGGPGLTCSLRRSAPCQRAEIPVRRPLRTSLEVLAITFNRFVMHDAWAIASHIALSVLTAFFPFLILVTALASFFGEGSLADTAADIDPRDLAEGGRRADRARSALRPHRPAERHLHRRPPPRALFRLERGREPARRAQSRLRPARDAALVVHAARIRSASSSSAPW